MIPTTLSSATWAATPGLALGLLAAGCGGETLASGPDGPPGTEPNAAVVVEPAALENSVRPEPGAEAPTEEARDAPSVAAILDEFKEGSRVSDGEALPQELLLRLEELGRDGALLGADFSGLDLVGLKLRSADLRGVDFSGSTLRDCDFGAYRSEGSSNLEGAVFRGATLESVSFEGAGLSGASFRDATFQQREDRGVAGEFREATLEGADFDGARVTGGAKITGFDLTGATAHGATFREAVMPGSVFVGCDVSGADFTGADLTDLELSAADIRGASFQGAELGGLSMGRPVGLDQRLRLGTTVNCATDGANFDGANLAGLVLEKQSFRFCSFDGARLVGTNLRGAVLTGSSFRGADLKGAWLERAHLAAVDFEGAICDQAELDAAHTVCATGLGALGSAASLPTVLDAVDQPVVPQCESLDLIHLELLLGEEAIDLAGGDFSGASFERLRIADATFADANFDGASFAMAELGGVDFSRCSLRGARFDLARVSGCNFSGADLAGASFFGASFGKTTLDGADLTGADFRYVTGGELGLEDGFSLRGAKAQGIDLSFGILNDDAFGATFGARTPLDAEGADFTGALWENAKLHGIRLGGANLGGLKARGAELPGATFDLATNWHEADFSGAWLVMGALETNQRKAAPPGDPSGPVLEEGDPSDGLKSNLQGASFEGALMAGFHIDPGVVIGAADFRGVDFHRLPWDSARTAGTCFQGIGLAGALFDGADLTGVSVEESDLDGTSFRGANLSGATFSAKMGQGAEDVPASLVHGARMTKVDFTGANLTGAMFLHGDFSECILDGAELGSGAEAVTFDAETTVGLSEKLQL